MKPQMVKNSEHRVNGPIQLVWPHDAGIAEAEQRLLAFTAGLLISLARTHPRVTQQQVAAWVARIALAGAK
jgi:hypothetical protein